MFDLAKTVQFKDSPEEAKAFYDEHGFHVEYDVWSKEECDTFNKASYDFPDRRDDDFTPLMHPHRKVGTYLQAIKKPAIVEMMKYFLGGEVSGLQTEYFFGKPGTRGFALHQDNFYLEAKQDAFGSAWSAMTDVSPENGGVFIYPGTNKTPILDTRPLTGGSGKNQDPNASNEECIVPPAFKPLDMSLPKGATVIFHGHLVHGSHDNLSDRFRNALLCTYIRKGEKFRAGNYAQRVEIPLEQ